MNYKELYNRTRKSLNGKITEVNELEIYTEDLRKENIALENQVMQLKALLKLKKHPSYFGIMGESKQVTTLKKEVKQLKDTVAMLEFEKRVSKHLYKNLNTEMNKIEFEKDAFEKDLNYLQDRYLELKGYNHKRISEQTFMNTVSRKQYDQLEKEFESLMESHQILANEMAKLENLILEYYKGAENLYIESGGTNA